MRLPLFVALLPLAACGSLSSEEAAAGQGGTTRRFDVSGFSAVTLVGSDDVEVHVGDGFAVRAEGPADVLDRLDITRDGDALRVSRRSGVSRGHVRVFVTMPRITAASITGSGDLSVDRVRGAGFAGAITGSGDLRLDAVAVTALSLALSGSGDITAAGETQRLNIESSGSGDVEAERLSATQADVSARGSGDVSAAVRGSARVRASGSGDVDLGAAARCSVQKSGSGSVRCGG